MSNLFKGFFAPPPVQPTQVSAPPAALPPVEVDGGAPTRDVGSERRVSRGVTPRRPTLLAAASPGKKRLLGE